MTGLVQWCDALKWSGVEGVPVSRRQITCSDGVGSFSVSFWGICVGDGARYSNHNYQMIKATLDGAGAGAPYGPLILFFTAGSVVLCF